MGAFASVVGPVVALTIGGFGPMLVAAGFAVRPNRVRDYRGVVEDEPVEPVASPDARPVAGETRRSS
jgi:hypothetical protein